jgi:hypothetical protein
VISDVLSDAVSQIDAYLDADAAGNFTGSELQVWIVSVRDSMEALRCILDRLPGHAIPDPVSYAARERVDGDV